MKKIIKISLIEIKNLQYYSFYLKEDEYQSNLKRTDIQIEIIKIIKIMQYGLFCTDLNVSYIHDFTIP